MADGRLVTSGRRPAGTSAGGRSPAHGFGDDEATRQLLRSRPPRQALAWAAAQLGAPVISARALRGGMSSAVHLLVTQPPGGQRRYAVLRRYVRAELNAEEPDIAAHEARALGIAGAAGLPTPALLAVDPDGTGAGVPAILMSRLPGRVEWWPSDTGRWLRRLAELLPRIHATPLPAPGTLPRFAPHPQDSYQPPGWTRQPRLWERAAEISGGPAPDLPAVLVHRDFHPGNVLWQRGAVTGVVDWQAACTGPAVADVGHCRINLLTAGTDAADRFTAWWQHVTGTAYHPWAEVVTIIGFLDDLRDGWGSERLLVEDMLARAVAELGLHLDFGLVRDLGLPGGLGFRLGFSLDAGGILASGFPVGAIGSQAPGCGGSLAQELVEPGDLAVKLRADGGTGPRCGYRLRWPWAARSGGALALALKCGVHRGDVGFELLPPPGHELWFASGLGRSLAGRLLGGTAAF